MNEAVRQLETIAPSIAALARCPWWVVVITIVLVVFLHGGEAVSRWLDAWDRLRRR